MFDRLFFFRNRYRVIFFVLLFSGMIGHSFGQHNSYDYFSVENGLSNNIIYSITQDQNGFLWISTFNGVNRYDGYEFKNYRNEPTRNNSIGNNNIGKIFKDSRNQLWFISTTSVDRYESKTDDFTHVVSTGTQSDATHFEAIEHNDSLFFIINDSCHIVSGITQKHLSSKSISYTKDQHILQIRNHRNDIYSLTYSAEILQIIPELQKNKMIEIPASSIFHKRIIINTGFIDQSNMLWIGTNTGLYKINLSTKPFHKISLPEIKGSGCHTNDITSVIQDRKGRLWIGTETNGLYVLSDQNTILQHYQYKPGTPHILINNSVYSLLEDHQGVIWAGGVNLLRYDEATNNFEYFQQDKNWPNTLYGWIVRDLYEDKDNNLWIVTLDGITYISPDRNHFSIFKGNEIIPAKNITKQYWRIGEDRNSDIWIPTGANLIVYKKEKRRFDISAYHPDDTSSLVNGIQCMYTDHDNQLWVATENRGLFQYQNVRETQNDTHYIFKNYTINNGFPSNDMYSILEDKRGNLWIGTSKGLCCFNKRTKKIRAFDTSDGLPANHFTTNCGYQSSNGPLYFGTDNGILFFNPDSIGQDTISPLIALTKLKLFNKEIRVGDIFNHHIILNSDISSLNELELSYKENAITFEFAALHFSAPHKNKYAYRLLGFHDEWIYTDADHRFAVYTSLPAGTYTFQVKASNNDGIWNEKSRSLTLIITPPFWQTWWFRILIAAFLVSVIWMIFRIRIMALKKIQDELERKVKEQTAEIVEKNDELVIQTDQLQRSNHDLNVANATKDKLFSIIAHDLKNPFQGIIGLSEILHTKFDSLTENERTEYLYQINISSKNTYTLLENLLTWARNQTQSIQYKPETVSVLSVVNETMGVLNLNLKNKKIGFLNNVLPEHCVISDKNMLTTIIRNLISNAIKFTPELGTISISSERSYDRIMIRIKDTGVGMGQDTINKLFRIDQHHTTRGTAGERGTGLGLMLCRDFIMYNKGTLNIESEPGKGSTFIIGLVRSASVPEPIAENKPVIQPHDEMDATHANHPAGHDHEKVLLLVDDDPSILSSLRKEIEVEYNVYTAENGSEGYKKALAMIPDLIVSDVSMPELNGFEFCGKIKQNKRTSHVPVILLTANDSDKDKMAGLETGADDYITKPFRSELLKVRIRNLIRLREQLKDIYCKKLISLEPVDVEIRNSADRKFIDCCIASIEQNLSDPDYSVDSLASGVAMSRAQMYRKFEGLLNITPNIFIRNYRLKKAAELLNSGTMNINEVCYQTGFSNPTIFRKWFQEQFGMNPSVFAQKNRK